MLMALKAEKLCLPCRSLPEVSSPHLWPQWLRLWKTSMAQTRSVTRLPIQMLFLGRPRTPWLSHTGKFYITMCLLSRVMFTTDFTVSSFCLHHQRYLSSVDIPLFIHICFHLRAPRHVACQHDSELPLFTVAFMFLLSREQFKSCRVCSFW